MAMALRVELGDCVLDSAVEVIGTVERLMSEVMPLQVAPEGLDVVQLRGILRQPLDREPVGARRGRHGTPCWWGSSRCREQARAAGSQPRAWGHSADRP